MSNRLEELKDKKKKIEEEMKQIKINSKKEREKKSVNELIRVSRKFDDDLEDVREELNISKPKITDLIVAHKFWPKLKEDLLNFIISNKKGQITMFLIFLIVGVFAVFIFLLVGGITAVRMNMALDQNISLGQVNLAEINSQTLGVATTTFLNNADWWGIAAIFGMILGLFLSAYFLRNKFSKFGIILDIFMIFAMFLISIYISQTYQVLLDSLVIAGETFLEDYTPKTSIFILNLPIFTVITGVICMILFHSSIPNKKEERYQAGGYLQGVQ